MDQRINELKERFKKSNIKFEEDIPENPEFHKKLIFEIHAGRENHECYLPCYERYLIQAESCEFEKYKFIQGYEAIWSSELGVIEAEINFNGSRVRSLDRLNELINMPDENEDDESAVEITSIKLPDVKDYQLSFEYASPEFLFLSARRERVPGSRNNRITFKIQNTKTKTHDSAKEILEKIANSLFFQIDVAFEVPIFIQVQRESWIHRREKSRRKTMFVDETAIISESKYEYDLEPISLYWYAKESMNMPIFQFLAFYQTIEFYFPIYSSYEAKQKIQTLIKDPRFNPNRDADISQIISTIQQSNGKSFGSERDQIKATINASTDNNELINFLKSDDNRFNFYAENKGKKISVQKISVKNENTDFVTEVSERIYDIRCKIVHSKASEGNSDVLLPYSSEVKMLNYDLELIEFISRKVLITSSRPINLS